MILSILKQLKPEYKVVVLKNEFGDVEVSFPAVNLSSAENFSIEKIESKETS